MGKIKQFHQLKKNFGFMFATKVTFFKLFRNEKQYIGVLKKYLNKNINLFDISYKPSKPIEKKRIWSLWWQGANEMPEILKCCYSSHIKNIDSKKYEYILITKENYKQYIDIPSFIEQKIDNGKMSLTHLSDYLRVCLLEKYGGFWLDITVFLSKQFPIEYFDFEFFSVKTGTKPENLGQMISENMWTGFLLGSNQEHSRVFQYLKHSLECYWEKYDSCIEYFLMNTFLRIAYEKDMTIKTVIDLVPVNNTNLSLLRKKFSLPGDTTDLKNLLNSDVFFKLTLKKKFETCVEDKKTLYAAFLEDNL